MSIIRKHRYERDFSVLPNAPAEDENLSHKAKGILWELLVKPPDWQVILQDLINRSKKDGKTAIYSGISELIEEGYIRKESARDEKGRITGIEYVVYESPQPKQQDIMELKLASVLIPTKSGDMYEVTHDKIQEYISRYPNIDVYQEINNLAQWSVDNPKRRKINIHRFLSNNLSRKNTEAANGTSKYGKSKQRISANGGAFE